MRLLPYREHLTLYWLLIAGLIFRGTIAAIIGLGNDEVYYWTYAAYPALSHFDHPPMVGYVMQLFTLNLTFDHEFFLRLASVVFASFSTYIIYLIGLLLRDRRTAIISAFLFTGSIYCSIISGLFIMPDTPLVPLWLIGLYQLLKVVNCDQVTAESKRHLLIAGLAIGMATLSKYHAVFLWFGAIAYMLIYDRKWLGGKSIYYGVTLSLLCILPIVLWNWQHDFISFRFQGERVNFFEKGIRPDRFATELGGQVFYNNPFNFILTLLAIIAVFKGKKVLEPAQQKLLMFVSLPLIGTILFFSLFRKTLPHWSGPAYLTLIPLVAAYVAQQNKRVYLRMVSGSVSLLFIVLMAGALEINGGFLTSAFGKEASVIEKKGKYDVTLDMYGWKEFSGKFMEIAERDVKNGIVEASSPIIANRWFTAAHLDYYVARPMQKKLLAFGSLNDIHKYAWINIYRGLPKAHENAYYITHSRAFNPPDKIKPYFKSVVATDTIPVYRNGIVAEYFFVYLLHDYQSNFPNPLPDFDKGDR